MIVISCFRLFCVINRVLMSKQLASNEMIHEKSKYLSVEGKFITNKDRQSCDDETFNNICISDGAHFRALETNKNISKRILRN